jgi:hypothetical protein
MFGVHKERDPALISLENGVYSSLKQISLEDDLLKNIIPEPKFNSSKGLCPPLSVEDAIKELLSHQKSGKIGHD